MAWHVTSLHVVACSVACMRQASEADQWACCLQELRSDNERLRLLETSAREAGQRAQHDAGRLQQENIRMSLRLVSNTTHLSHSRLSTPVQHELHAEHAGGQVISH